MINVRRCHRLAVILVAAAVAILATAPPSLALPGQYWVSKLQLSKVWNITRGAGVTIAVVDSGVPRTSDLGGRLLAGTDLASGGGDGRSDPGEASTGGSGAAYSHGQNMAELIAGDGSGGNIAGIAPLAKILPVKVQTRTGGSLSPTLAAQGIRYAVDHGAQVVNLSIGGPGQCASAPAAAVKYAYDHDAIVVVSAGNSGQPAVETPGNCPGALSVAGVASNAAIWSGSDYGSDVDLANFAVRIPTRTLNGTAGTSDGTSNAAAFTSGEIALLRARYPHDSARDIVTRLLYGIDTLSSVSTGTRVNDHVGYGIPVPLDALRDNVPADAPNPIYDEFEQELGPTPGTSTTPSSPSGGASSSEVAPPSSDSSSPAASASDDKGGGIGALPIVLIVVVVLVVLAVIAVVVARSRRRGPPGPPPGYGPPGGYGPPPGGYGSPPPGYGPPTR